MLPQPLPTPSSFLFLLSFCFSLLPGPEDTPSAQVRKTWVTGLGSRPSSGVLLAFA